MLDVPLTVKIRTGVQEKVNVAHKIIPRIREWGASMVTVRGQSCGVGAWGVLPGDQMGVTFPCLLVLMKGKFRC